MVYITVRQPPQYHQITLEELLFSADKFSGGLISNNETNTRTYTVFRPSPQLLMHLGVGKMIRRLHQFNESTKELRGQPRQSLYHTFYIPKKTRGLRRIDAPCDELMDSLRSLKRMFENEFGALYHTSAFAYVKKRSTKDAVIRHQQNESKWFAKLDLSNFFGSTTLDFTMRMLGMIYPFSEICRNPYGYKELEKAVELGFLNGGLPQGTPLSPTLTNIIMIPFDYTLNKRLRSMDQRYIETRYADDFAFSCRYAFNVKDIENVVQGVIREFDAPYVLNTEKTKYGSSAGSNWLFGMILNADNQITVGAKNKRQFKAMLTSYALDRKGGVEWDKHDIQVLAGLRNYYRMVEEKEIDDIVTKIGGKFGVNIPRLIHDDLKAA